MDKKAGILVHISSLYNKYGIGTFGEELFSLIDFLNSAKQSYLQVLPLNQTSYGDSPYQSPSSFALNPYFIDFDLLKKDGLLKLSDYDDIYWGKCDEVDYGNLFFRRYDVLKIAYLNFIKKDNSIYNKFKEENSYWLDDYALFMAIKKANDYKSWLEFDEPLKRREKQAIESFSTSNKEDIEYFKVLQYFAFSQFKNAKNYAYSKGVEIIGDMPIYVALDSADVWANPKMFALNEELLPTLVAGVPPDRFASDGQLWGNPLYDYAEHKKDGYKWWGRRISHMFKIVDVLRIDHFRGFESYYAIPYGDKTAKNGSWVKGPGAELFKAISGEKLNIIAEDLGIITNEVRAMLEEVAYPGMKVLQFAFDSDDNNEYLPTNYGSNCIVYTGTHDNDTSKGWIESTLNQENVMERFNRFTKKYKGSLTAKLIELGFDSEAKIAIVPIQDWLNLGSEARMNFPSKTGWWKYRLKNGELSEKLAKKIAQVTKKYKRG